MGGEGIFLLCGALILWSLIGFVAAVVVQLIWKLEALPVWVALWIAFVGTTVTMFWYLPARPG